MRVYPSLKPALDILGAMVLLVLLSPVLLVASLLIWMESGGPVFFRQDRPGKDGRIFSVMKFRTMMPVTVHEGVRASDTQRITRIGGFLRNSSIDELPQLFNILRLEMSFIGPRPLLVRYLPFYTPQELKRHSVRPGISGWAQVNGRNAISWDRKFAYDLEYVEKLSFLLDCRIAWMTLLKVFGRSNIIPAGEAESTVALDVERSAAKRDSP